MMQSERTAVRAVLGAAMATTLLLASGAVGAADWPPPGGETRVGSGAPVQPQGTVGAITFSETEFTPPTLVDGLTVSTLNGVPIAAPLSFTCTIAGVSDPGCDIASGPGTQQFVDDLGIEAETAALLGIDFGTDVDSVSFGFALACPPPVSPGVTINAFDAGGNPVGSTSVDAIDTGFDFAENMATFSGPVFRRVELTFNSAGGSCFAFLLDNLAYDTFGGSALPPVPQPNVISTNSVAGLLGMIALLAVAAFGFLRRR